MKTALVLGVDGGGSRTRAVLVRLSGEVVARASAGPSNMLQVGLDGARKALGEAIMGALREGGVDAAADERIRAIVAGVAGAGAAADQQVLAGALAVHLAVAPSRIRVYHDMRVALAGALPGDEGAVLIAGTGSVCYGRTREGEEWRAGGLGPVLDDGGSGYWLGVQGLRACVRAADGRAEKSPLVEAMEAKLGLGGPREILRFVREQGDDRRRIAALAPLVIATASAGDAAAAAIVTRGAAELALMAEAVLTRLRMNGGLPRLAGCGGLLEHERSYRRVVDAAIGARQPGVKLRAAAMEGCAGAALLALAEAGARPGSAVVKWLRETSAGH